MSYTEEELKAGIEKARIDLIADRYKRYNQNLWELENDIKKINAEYKEFDEVELVKKKNE
jgi:hypothetical protein